MHQKEADLKPKSSAQATSSVVPTPKEQILFTWEELTVFHSSRLKQSSSNRGSAPLYTPIRSCTGLSCSSWVRRVKTHTQLLSSRSKRLTLSRRHREAWYSHNQSCSKGGPTFPVLFHALGHSLKKAAKSLTEVQPHTYLGWPSLVDTRLPCLAL